MTVEFPADIKELRRHAQLYVAVRVVAATQKPPTDTEVLAGRCHTRFVVREGTILEIKPPMQTPHALKRNDQVKLRIVRELDDVLLVAGTVVWTRPKVFLPDGVAVSCAGIDFEPLTPVAQHALERFVERIEPPGYTVSFPSVEAMVREYEQNLKIGGILVPGGDAPEPLSRVRVRLVLPAGAVPPGQSAHVDVEVDVVFAGPAGWGGQLVAPLRELHREILAGRKRS